MAVNTNRAETFIGVANASAGTTRIQAGVLCDPGKAFLAGDAAHQSEQESGIIDTEISDQDCMKYGVKCTGGAMEKTQKHTSTTEDVVLLFAKNGKSMKSLENGLCRADTTILLQLTE